MIYERNFSKRARRFLNMRFLPRMLRLIGSRLHKFAWPILFFILWHVESMATSIMISETKYNILYMYIDLATYHHKLYILKFKNNISEHLQVSVEKYMYKICFSKFSTCNPIYINIFEDQNLFMNIYVYYI